VCAVGADQTLCEEHQGVSEAPVEPGVDLRPLGAGERRGPDARQRGPPHRLREGLLEGRHNIMGMNVCVCVCVCVWYTWSAGIPAFDCSGKRERWEEGKGTRERKRG